MLLLNRQGYEELSREENDARVVFCKVTKIVLGGRATVIVDYLIH